MTEHPIQSLMKTAMENIREMVDVDTIVGNPVETPDGTVIMPVSKVGFGFAAGGSEFYSRAGNQHDHMDNRQQDRQSSPYQGDGNQPQQSGPNPPSQTGKMPFGGGSGGGVSITPIAFLVVNSSGVKVVPLDNQTHLYERLIDSAPEVLEKLQSMFQSKQPDQNRWVEGQQTIGSKLN